ncbi:hypothetical protein P872_10370 [Rhodonellum psychrophilum GCM71 = DSM 17998]|uniref:Uncharacterized protein n=1 Tax=Rhodonellum psychrophilum GCM71 = DSM 17998 TaxID=1123057 RepID=U5BLN4_9BACT|nr:hypothetical protein P872_10370 [Rhodonellum psychrophilum GCM71 = DSM 17998]
MSKCICLLQLIKDEFVKHKLLYQWGNLFLKRLKNKKSKVRPWTFCLVK